MITVFNMMSIFCFCIFHEKYEPLIDFYLCFGWFLFVFIGLCYCFFIGFFGFLFCVFYYIGVMCENLLKI